MASTVGIPDWYEGEHRNELKIDQRFILGWSEALYHLYGGRIEWVGSWTVSTENEECKAQRDVDVLLEWCKTGLFDDRNILLTVRQEKDNFIVKTYAVNGDKTAREVPNMISRSKIS